MSAAERDPDRPSGSRRGAGDEPAPQAGVLGNLPRKRPAVRSPRRASTTAKDEVKPSAAQPPEPKPPPAPGGPERDAAEEPEHSRAADLEGLARGGIAIAGGAAALGLRIAGRAATALRDAVERR